MDAASTESTTVLRGEVVYRDRRALSDQAELVLALTDADRPGAIVAPRLLALAGEQAPIAFELPLPEDVDLTRIVRLEAALLEPDGTARIGTSAAFAPADGLAIGQLPLRFLADEDFQARFRCGEVRVQVFSIGDRAVLAVDGEQRILDASPAASGARFERAGDEFWSHQGTARLILDGRDYPECQAVEGADAGAAALIDVDWQVIEIAGQAPVADSAPALRFLSDEGRLAGTAGCNRFGAPYTLDGAALGLGPMMSTLMACPDEAVNAQEQRMAAALAKVERFELISPSELHLLGADEVLIRARRHLD
jgi:heat shock protein HslJ